jgi:hypothetical protein
MVAGARVAAVSDSVASLNQLPGLDRLIIAHAPLVKPDLDAPPKTTIVWEPDPLDQPFHFGNRLAELIERYDLSNVLYLGAGSQPLLPSADLQSVLQQLGQQPTVMTNNLHSADWVAFNHAPEVRKIAHWLNRDNMLAWRLWRDLNFQAHALPPSISTRLDIDTPFDLQVLALHPRTPPHLRAHLKRSESRLNLSQFQRASLAVCTPGSRVTLIGRVSSTAADLLGAHQLWTRVFSEERGMVANRRQAEGQVFSFVADYIDRIGEAEFIARLSQTSDLVLFDTRVYMAHHHLWPTDEERFASDLGLSEKISDARLRRLTEAVGAAPIPILLGGHNVVSGGIFALLEIAGFTNPE